MPAGFSAILRLACILLLFPGSPAWSQNAPVTAAATVGNLSPGAVDIPITVTGFNNIGAISLSIDYDFSVLNFTGSTPHPQLPGFPAGDQDLGNGLHRVSMGWFGSGRTLPDSSTIITLHFTYLGGSCGLTWYDNGPSCEYADGNYIVLNDIPTSDYYLNGHVCAVLGAAGPITGAGEVCQGASEEIYSVEQVANAGGYTWAVPDGAEITSGQNTSIIMVSFSDTAVSGDISVYAYDACSNGPAAVLPVEVHPLPLADAGDDFAINYGTSTTLQAAPGGSGTYTYHWAPEGLLVNPFVMNPQTVILTATTIFTLTVTDTETNCQSTDDVIVVIIGGPLSVAPVIFPASICAGETAQLFANAGGGSGNYTYAWTCVPPGTPPWSSNLPNPLVSPDSSRQYLITVYDGFSSASGSAGLTVFPIPATPEITVIGYELISSACCGNQWFKDDMPIAGATGQTYLATESGQYQVVVTLDGCSSEPSDPVDLFVGIGEHSSPAFAVYPNPARQKITVNSLHSPMKPETIRLVSASGKVILSHPLDPSVESMELDVSPLPAGIYFLVITGAQACPAVKISIL